MKVGDVVEVVAWKPVRRIPPVTGLQGHDPIPEKGDAITVYVKSKTGKDYEPVLPNGISIKAKKKQKKPTNQYQASEELSELGPAALPPLLDVLRDPKLRHERGMSVAVITCGRLENAAEAVPTLIRFLEGPESRSHHLVIQTLLAIGDASAVKAIRPFLNSTDKEIWKNAAVALCRFRDFESAAAIAKSALEHSGDQANPSDIHETAVALMEMDQKAGSALIEKLLKVEAMKDYEKLLRSELEKP